MLQKIIHSVKPAEILPNSEGGALTKDNTQWKPGSELPALEFCPWLTCLLFLTTLCFILYVHITLILS